MPLDPRSKRDDLKHNTLHRLVAMCRADLESNRAPRVYFNWKRPHALQVFGSCSRTMITVNPRDVTAAYPFAFGKGGKSSEGDFCGICSSKGMATSADDAKSCHPFPAVIIN